MDLTKNDNHVKWHLATQGILSAAHMSPVLSECARLRLTLTTCTECHVIVSSSTHDSSGSTKVLILKSSCAPPFFVLLHQQPIQCLELIVQDRLYSLKALNGIRVDQPSELAKLDHGHGDLIEVEYHGPASIKAGGHHGAFPCVPANWRVIPISL